MEKVKKELKIINNENEYIIEIFNRKWREKLIIFLNNRNLIYIENENKIFINKKDNNRFIIRNILSFKY